MFEAKVLMGKNIEKYIFMAILPFCLSSCASFIGGYEVVSTVTNDVTECVSKKFDECIFPEQSSDLDDVPYGATEEELLKHADKQASISY